MTIFQLNEFVLHNSGPAGQILHHHTHGSADRPINSFFFNPYQDYKDALLRTATVFTAPFLLTAHSLYCIGQFFNFAIKSITHFIYDNSEKGGNDLVESVIYLVLGLISLIVAAVSPVINLCELVGGGVSSIVESLNTIAENPSHTHP